MKTLLFIITFCLSIRPQSADNYIADGDEFYKKFDLKNAAVFYKKAFESDSSDYLALLKITRIYNDLAEYYYEQKDDVNAEASVNKALRYALKFKEKFPDSAAVYTLLAMSYGNTVLFKGGNEKVKLAYKIKENVEKAIKLNPDDFLAYIILSIYHRQIASLNWFEKTFANIFFSKVPEGSFEESEKMMLKALSIQPGVVIAMFHLSLTYKEMNDEQKEIYWLKKILDASVYDFRDKYAKQKAKRRLNEILD